MQIVQNELTVAQAQYLEQAKLKGEITPFLEIFDIARERFYKQSEHSANQQTQTQQNIKPQAKKVEPPKIETTKGSKPVNIENKKLDLKRFGNSSSSEQVEMLIEMGLV